MNAGDVATNRLVYIDYAKGIGIFFVVLLHAGFAPQWLFIGVSAFHMPLFFIISGLLFSHSTQLESMNRKNALLRIKKTAGRLLWPYVVFEIICIVILIANSAYGDSVSVFLSVSLTGFVMLFGISVLWFLPALFLGEALFILMFLAVKTLIQKMSQKAVHTKRNIFLFILALGLLLVTIPAQGSILVLAPVAEPYGIWVKSYAITVLLRAAEACSLITMGYLIKGLLEKIAGKLPLVIRLSVGCVLIAAAMILASFNSPVDVNHVQLGNPALFLVNAMLGSFGVLLIAQALPDIRTDKKSSVIKTFWSIPFRMLRFAGVNSLIIMCTHVDWLVIYYANLAALHLNRYVTRARVYVMYTIIVTLIIVTEWILCVAIKRGLPFLIYPVRRKNVS